MISIRLWEFSNGYWHQVFTRDHLETKDENKYFRVLRNCHKEFYKSVQDYKLHNSVKKVITVNGVEY